MSETMQKMTRLKDVAVSANVSNTTASLILNGKGKRFPKDTQSRVQKLAKKMGWEPNLLSNSILSGKTQTIGVLVGPVDSYYNDVLTGMHRAIAERDYLPITIWENVINDDYSKNDNGLAQIKRLIGRRVDGMILRPVVAISYESHFNELMSRQLPVVVIDHMFDDSHKADSVGSDEDQGMELALDHLAGLGHRKIAYLDDVSLAGIDFSIDRRRAFEYAAKERGCEYEIYDVNLLDCSGKDKYGKETLLANVHAKEVVVKMLKGEFGATAVVCSSDYCAKLVYGVAKDEQISIPEDISVVGCAGLDFTSEMDPPLTTIKQDGEQIGRKTAELLIEKIKCELAGRSKQSVKVGCELLVRQSTAKMC